MSTENMNALVVALIAAIPTLLAALAAWTSRQNAHALATPSGRTIGEHIDALQDELAKVADAKLLADAKLTSAAISAMAKLADGQDRSLIEAAEKAAQSLLAVAAALPAPGVLAAVVPPVPNEEDVIPP